MATVTSHIGLVATASTTADHPFHVARRFASLDHISHGRAAWNFVTSQQDAIAQNFGFKRLPDHAERYRRADEFVEVVVKLGIPGTTMPWSPMRRPAAMSISTACGPSTMRASGSVRGPQRPRPPQGRPMLVHQAIRRQPAPGCAGPTPSSPCSGPWRRRGPSMSTSNFAPAIRA